jgi:hypothetical protein
MVQDTLEATPRWGLPDSKEEMLEPLCVIRHVTLLR